MIKNFCFKLMAVLEISAVIISGCCSPAMAAGYVVRCDGGTAAQCDGTHDAPLAGAVDGADPGTLPDCALNSPNYGSGANGQTGGAAGLMVGGDTIIIDGELHSGCAPTLSGRAEYEIGSGAPNMPAGGNCSAPGAGFPYGCYPNAWPAGTSLANKTKIYGKGYNTGCKKPPQLWGSNAAGAGGARAGIFRINSFTAFGCLEVTDHSGCIHTISAGGTIDNNAAQDPIACSTNYTGSGPGRWAETGIRFQDGAHDVDIRDTWVHGLGMDGVWGNFLAGTFSMVNFYIFKNGYDNWTGNDNAHYTGSYSWTGGTNSFAGCGQKYPGTYTIPRSKSQWRDRSDVHNCWTQGQGAGYGDCYGISARSGSWTIKRTDAFGCSSDVWDFLYDSSGTMTFAQNTCEGNNGSCFKSGSGSVNVENNTLIGNCTNYKNNPTVFGSPTALGRSGSSCNNNGLCDANENFVNCGDCTAYAFCRANTPLSINTNTGSQAKILNNTIVSNFDVAIYLQGVTAGGTAIVKNNMLIGGQNYLNGTDMGDLSDGIYSEGAGVTITRDYNVECGTKNITTACSGSAHSQCFTSCNSLNLAGTMMNNNPTFYQGNDYISSFFLTATSPAHGINAADETVPLVSTAFDATGFNRRSTWDAGGFEYRPLLHFSTDEFRVDQ